MTQYVVQVVLVQLVKSKRNVNVSFFVINKIDLKCTQ